MRGGDNRKKMALDGIENGKPAAKAPSGLAPVTDRFRKELIKSLEDAPAVDVSGLGEACDALVRDYEEARAHEKWGRLLHAERAAFSYGDLDFDVEIDELGTCSLKMRGDVHDPIDFQERKFGGDGGGSATLEGGAMMERLAFLGMRVAQLQGLAVKAKAAFPNIKVEMEVSATSEIVLFEMPLFRLEKGEVPDPRVLEGMLREIAGRLG